MTLFEGSIALIYSGYRAYFTRRFSSPALVLVGPFPDVMQPELFQPDGDQNAQQVLV
jgi:hypothetical protein